MFVRTFAAALLSVLSGMAQAETGVPWVTNRYSYPDRVAWCDLYGHWAVPTEEGWFFDPEPSYVSGLNITRGYYVTHALERRDAYRGLSAISGEWGTEFSRLADILQSFAADPLATKDWPSILNLVTSSSEIPLFLNLSRADTRVALLVITDPAYQAYGDVLLVERRMSQMAGTEFIYRVHLGEGCF